MSAIYKIPEQSQSTEFKNLVKTAVSDLQSGSIIVMPSDTLFGLFSGISDDQIRKMHAVKKRSHNKPFLLVLPETYPLDEFVNFDLMRKEMLLQIQKFWPGRNTLIFPKKQGINYPEGESIAIRKPSKQDNIFFYEVLNLYGKPLLAPSLNVHGEAPLTHLVEIIRVFGNEVESIFFDDFFMPGLASQIWDLSGKTISRLR